MTKTLNDDLKCPILPEDIKIEITPTIIETSLAISAPNIGSKRKPSKTKVRMVKNKVTTKKSQLEKATYHLYDLENCHGPEKILDIDLGLYQMEDF